MTAIIEEDALYLRELVERYGASAVKAQVDGRVEHDGVLTIVANQGVHPVPSDYIFGELFLASEGNLDFSDIDSVNREIDLIIRKIHDKLNEKIWTKVYLIPFGHSVVAMSIKLAVYRILRIETIDVFYFGGGRYALLERDMRKAILG